MLGSDHHGYVARVRAGLVAMGQPADCLDVRLMQFVTLYRGGEKVQMSTRSGEFITLRELRREVGNDAARFFYVMRSNEQHLDFDMQLATSQSNENPVYYIQYAHARVCSVLRQMREKGFELDAARGRAGLHRLAEPHEQALLASMSRYREVVESAALQRAPHAHGALPARARDRFPRVLQRAPVPGRRRRTARRARHADPGRAAGRAQWPRTARRVRAGGDVT